MFICGFVLLLVMGTATPQLIRPCSSTLVTGIDLSVRLLLRNCLSLRAEDILFFIPTLLEVSLGPAASFGRMQGGQICEGGFMALFFACQ